MSVAAFKNNWFYSVDPTSNGKSKQQIHEQRMKYAEGQLERHQKNFFIVNFEQISH